MQRRKDDMKNKENSTDESPYAYPSMGSFLAANYYKNKFDETKDPIYLEKYKFYQEQLKQLEKQEVNRLQLIKQRKWQRGMFVPLVLCGLFLTSLFGGGNVEVTDDVPDLIQEIQPTPITTPATSELEEALPKGYHAFPLKSESQSSTPTEQILNHIHSYELSNLDQVVYADLSVVLRNALYQYVKNHNREFPEDLNVLFQKLPKNYLTAAPKDPFFFTNQIKSAYDGTGGWVYDFEMAKELMNEKRSLQEAVEKSLICNGNCGKPDFTPLQITIVRSRHELMVHSKSKIYAIYPVALGKTETETPLGTFTIKRKIAYPRSDLEQAQNPYGSRVIELSNDDYAIHGTPEEQYIGKNISKGCIRMKNADIIEMYAYTSIGTPVKIVDYVSEEPVLKSIQSEKNDVKILTPTPMILSAPMILQTKEAGENMLTQKKEQPEENTEVAEENHSGGGASQAGDGGSGEENELQQIPNIPEQLLPIVPRSDEQSPEVSKWKN